MSVEKIGNRTASVALDCRAEQGKHFINAAWHPSSGGQRIEVRSPADGGVIGAIARGTADDIDLAVAAADLAFNGEWGAFSATQRGRLLLALSDRILQDVERLAWIEAADTGKPISLARNDIRILARYFEYYGGAADKIGGHVIPFEQGYSVVSVREPHGVTAHIIPWNYPAQMLGRSVAPALAMGNAAVVKPAEDACLTSLEIAILASEVGFPAGVFNVVTGYGEEAGAALSAHPGIRYISFTGSPQVGTLVQQAAAANYVPTALELGGKSPQLVFADADLERAADSVVKGITQNAGQTCSAGSRVLVERTIFDRFLALLAKRFLALRVGIPLDDPDVGPLINATQKERVLQAMNQAQEEGIPIVARTELSPSLPEAGHFVAPTVFGPVDHDHSLAQDEIFGPVLVAIPFENEEDAIAIANGTDFGLVASVWTCNGDRQARLSKRIRCGQFFINCYGAGGGVELPFGGSGKSGHGREKGWVALEELSTIKTVVHFHG